MRITDSLSSQHGDAIKAVFGLAIYNRRLMVITLLCLTVVSMAGLVVSTGLEKQSVIAGHASHEFLLLVLGCTAGLLNLCCKERPIRDAAIGALFATAFVLFLSPDPGDPLHSIFLGIQKATKEPTAVSTFYYGQHVIFLAAALIAIAFELEKAVFSAVCVGACLWLCLFRVVLMLFVGDITMVTMVSTSIGMVLLSFVSACE